MWHTLDAHDVAARLQVDVDLGLTAEEAARRLAQDGPNELPTYRVKSRLAILREQLTSTMVAILVAASAVSVALGDYQDAAAILAIVALNTILGYTQEYRAEQAIVALRRLAVPTVRVRRGGRVEEIPARHLVAGDIVLLESGNVVPADLRVVEAVHLRTQEAALTGESAPVDKTVEALDQADLPLGDRRNMAYMGTTVSYGRGAGVAIGTGTRTELGRIATMMQTVGAEPTPLQRRMDQLGRQLGAAALAIVAAIFVAGLLRGQDVKLMFLTAVSLAVAAVPEGLPAVVTIALSLGAQRMLKRRALIRKLPAVETLGSVTAICSDKTGTLTENEMRVTVLDVAGHQLRLATTGVEAAAMEMERDASATLSDRPALALLLAGGALCNDALLEPDPTNAGAFRVVGDPTEAALVAAASSFGLWKGDLAGLLPRAGEVPFDSSRKRMTTIHGTPPAEATIPASLQPVERLFPRSQWPPRVAFTKGAVGSLLEVCGRAWIDTQPQPLTDELRDRIIRASERLAADGMRVLGVAFRPLSASGVSSHTEDVERDLVFVGMSGITDPPRPEVRRAILGAARAGIRSIMITGDHPLTAQHVAREIGIATGGRVLTGRDLDRLSVEDLEHIADEVSIYARVSPEHKLKIVEALQHRGHIVAMTGDGVNDAPALRKADVGVAMGVTGTDVAREAADIVLLDDNFATIVAAVEEGRTIYDNVRKFVRYLVTSNSGEIIVMAAAPLLGMPLPLLPLQILWINLVTDGPPALALSVEPPEPDVMRRSPRPPVEAILSRGLGWYVVTVGSFMGVLSLGLGYVYWRAANPAWQTMVFTTLTFSQMAHILAIRSERVSLAALGLRSNLPLLYAVALTMVLQLAVVYVPFLQRVFATQALPAKDVAVSVLLSGTVAAVVELAKWRTRRNPGAGAIGSLPDTV
jgi:Ca2+-transporting ATPase